jgi:Protein of unknown function (DUF4038)/Putative collagen-binding domain of a collagenase
LSLRRQLFFLLALVPIAACRPRPSRGGPPLPDLRGLHVAPQDAHLGEGQRLQLSVTADYADGSRRDVTLASLWATGEDAGVLLAEGGAALGRAPGAVDVEAVWGGTGAHTTLVVEREPVPLRALSVEPVEAALKAGGAVALACTAQAMDGGTRDVTGDVSWSSSNAAVATLGTPLAPALLEATRPGVAEVTARLGALVARARVHVQAGVPPRPAFPLAVSSSGRFLVDARGAPFRLQGEAAWSLIANLTAAQVDSYLEDRAQKGFNAVLVNLLEHKFALQPPENRAGDAPFQVGGGFSTPAGPYFNFAEAMVEKAQKLGFLVLLAPAYPGYGCPTSESSDNEGWSAEMGHSPASGCLAYGRFAGRRFGKFDNVLWVQGGDCMPPPGSALEACALQVMAGIREAGGTALETGHWSPNSTSRDEPAFAQAMQLEAVYQYLTPYPACRRAYARTPPLPAFLVESGYENETNQGSSAPSRKYLYWASLACTAGFVSGSRPIWLFDEGWEHALDSPGANDVARLGHLLDTLPWEALVPSGLSGMRTLVTAGGGLPGGQDEVAAAATPDGRALLAYVPPGDGSGDRSFVVDVRVLSGPATARWYNPWTGAYVPIGLVPTETPRWFTTPGDNGSGYDDWVLVLTSTTSELPRAVPQRPASR